MAHKHASYAIMHCHDDKGVFLPALFHVNGTAIFLSSNVEGKKRIHRELFNSETTRITSSVLEPNEKIPFEIHATQNQFVFVHSGSVRVKIGAGRRRSSAVGTASTGGDDEMLDAEHNLVAGVGLVIPRGAKHEIENVGDIRAEFTSTYTKVERGD